MSASSDSMNELPNPDTEIRNNLPLLLGVSGQTLLSVIISSRVFFIVLITSKKRFRPANTLVAHLSFVVISFTIVSFVILLGKSFVINLATPGLCNTLIFFINVIYNVFSLNIGAIIWARMRSNAIDLQRSAAYRTLCLMWSTALVINLPLLFMVKTITSPDKKLNTCKPDLLFRSSGATTAFESFRLLFFNVAVCMYLIRASMILKASMKYIRLLKGETMTKRVKQIRYVHLHTIVLIFGWFPTGVVLFLLNVSAPVDPNTDFIKHHAIIFVLCNIVLILCPLSYVFILEDISFTKFCVPCFLTNTSSLPVVIYSYRQNDPEAFGCRVNPINPLLSVPPKERLVTWSKKTGVRIQKNIDVSLLTTVGLTAPSSSLSHSKPPVFSSGNSSYVHACSTPALMTPSTSAKQQTFAVEVQVHVEPNIVEGENEMEFGERNTEKMI